MAQQTRKDPRAKVLSMTVRYKSATLDEFIEHHSHDVSRGGMFVKTPQPFPPGTLLKFEVRIAEDRKVMQGVGRVVWKRDLSTGDAERPSGMGVKFIKLDDDSRRLIDQLLSMRREETSTFDSEGSQPGVDTEVPIGLGTELLSTPPPKTRETSAGDEPSFFPKDEPAELPEPEDRTVMKQAAELLQEALRGAGSEVPVAPKAPSLAPVGDDDKEDTKPGRSSKPGDSVARLPAPKMPPARESGAAPSRAPGKANATEMASVAKDITDKARKISAPKATPIASTKPSSQELRTSADGASKPKPAPDPSKVTAAQPATAQPVKGSGRGMFWLIAVAACVAGTWWLWEPRSEEPPSGTAPAVGVREAPNDVVIPQAAENVAAGALASAEVASQVASAATPASSAAAAASAALQAPPAATSAATVAPQAPRGPAPVPTPVAKAAAVRAAKSKAAASTATEASAQNGAGDGTGTSKPAEAKPAAISEVPAAKPAPADVPKKRKAPAVETDNPY